jgi:hypothetical protein
MKYGKLLEAKLEMHRQFATVGLVDLLQAPVTEPYLRLLIVRGQAAHDFSRVVPLRQPTEQSDSFSASADDR